MKASILATSKRRRAETMTNLRAVIAEAEKNGFRFKPADTHLKLYLRDPEHLDHVKAIAVKAFPVHCRNAVP